MFTIDGPGKILGVGNGDPSSHEPDKANLRRAFNGHCLAIVQADEKQGDIVIRATSVSLQADMAVIRLA